MAERGRDARSSRGLLVVALAAVLLLTQGLLLFPAAGRDDAFISYWPAHTLAEHGELLNFNGDRVEQSSSLLHVVAIAAVVRVTDVDIIGVGWLSGIAFGVLTVALAFVLGRRLHPEIGGAAAVLTATTANVAYWSFGGMETTMVAAAMLWLVISGANVLACGRCVARCIAVAVAATLAFAMVRPEAPIVLSCGYAAAAAMVAGRAWRRSKACAEELRVLRRLMLLTAIAVACSAALFLFRRLYFGDWFPQPVYAKTEGPTWSSLYEGASYLWSVLLDLGILGLVVPIGVAFAATDILRVATRVRPPLVLAVSFALTYCAFIVVVGGDWMEGGRFFVHVAPLLVVFAPLVVLRWTGSGRRFHMAMIGLLALQLFPALDLAATASVGRPLWAVMSPAALEEEGVGFSWLERANRVHARDIPVVVVLDRIVEALLRERGGKVTVLSGQLGMVPYHLTRRYYRRIEFLDRRGLADRAFSSCRTTSSLRRSSRYSGLQMTYSDYFALATDLERECEIPRPEVIFDLGAPGEVFSAHGYVRVYSQLGSVASGSSLFPGGFVAADEFILVRSDLLPFVISEYRPRTVMIPEDYARMAQE